MTDSEAKGFVQGKLDCMEKCDVFNKEDKHSNNECELCDYCYSQGNFGEQKEAFQMAIQALEKQIPKKPIFANNMMTKDKFLMCPCCEFRFPDSLVFLKTRCWNCGQKLDWSDEE